MRDLGAGAPEPVLSLLKDLDFETWESAFTVPAPATDPLTARCLQTPRR